ncbi:hypothetical protein [Janibacter sp. GXQ6167]|uniref:hypothetical protein n=1 Tax=Janibacter sp. GXQ6167 TaxID=3240791 RepID=UPI003525A2C3
MAQVWRELVGEPLERVRASALPALSEAGIEPASYTYLMVGGLEMVRGDSSDEVLQEWMAGKVRPSMKAEREREIAEGGWGWFWYRVEADAPRGLLSVWVSADPPPLTGTDGELIPFRQPGRYMRELTWHPRDASRVPGWMKVELAVVGAWDLVADEPRFTDRRESTGTPQTPEGLGVEPPAGAELAWGRAEGTTPRGFAEYDRVTRECARRVARREDQGVDVTWRELAGEPLERVRVGALAALREAGIAPASYTYLLVGRLGMVREDPPYEGPERATARKVLPFLEAEREREIADGGWGWFWSRVEADAPRGVLSVWVSGDPAPLVELDGDRSPFREPGLYVSELLRMPRDASRVPGWMKVELAAVGAWDLVADEPRFTERREPTGKPQTPEGLGVEPPEGAELAWGRAEGTPSRGVAEYDRVTRECARRVARGEGQGGLWAKVRSVLAGDRRSPAPAAAGSDDRFAPDHAMTGDVFEGFASRWAVLAGRFPELVRMVDGVDVEAGVGVAPVFREAAAAFPGVEVALWEFSWLTGADESSEEVGSRRSQQPLMWHQRQGVVVRVDPESGAAGEVVAVSEGDVVVIASGVVEFFDRLTGFAEEVLPRAWEEAGEAAEGDAEGRVEIAREIVGDELQETFSF